MNTQLISDQDFKIYGEKIYIRKLNRHDFTDRYLSWLNDPIVNKHSSRYGKTFCKRDLKSYVNNMNSTNYILVGIFTMSNKEHIGNTLLGPIDFDNRSSEISNLIGEKEYWEKGVALESCKLLIDYAFSNLELHKITIGNLSPNRGATFLSKQLGFRLEGKLIEAVFLRRKYYNVLRFGLFKDEFYEKFPSLLDNRTNKKSK